MKIMTDSPIRFPGLFGDWTITLSSKAINIGNGIYWYGILIALGMLVALWWCMRQRTKYGIREDDLIDGLLWGIPCGIIGARIYYVLFYLSQFKDHEGRFSWSKAIAIWDGGLAIYGGVIAVVIVAIILCRSRHIKLGAMMDLVVMGLLIGLWRGNHHALAHAVDHHCRGAGGGTSHLPVREPVEPHRPAADRFCDIQGQAVRR